VVGTGALAVGPPRVGDRGGGDDDRQPGEPERVAEEADVVGDAEVAEPALPVDELQAGVEVETGHRDRPEHQLRERDEERERARSAARQRQDPDDERRGEGNEDQRGRHRTLRKTTTTIAAPSAIARA
jgi:hypothetical protein